LIAIALLWGRGDFLESVALAIRGGEDTDSDAATVGSVMGALLGSAGVPGHLASAFNNRVRSAVRDFDRIGIDELAERTVHVADRCYEESQVQ
jgi:ADP-ribosylglycohydrolase